MVIVDPLWKAPTRLKRFGKVRGVPAYLSQVLGRTEMSISSVLVIVPVALSVHATMSFGGADDVVEIQIAAVAGTFLMIFPTISTKTNNRRTLWTTFFHYFGQSLTRLTAQA